MQRIYFKQKEEKPTNIMVKWVLEQKGMFIYESKALKYEIKSSIPPETVVFQTVNSKQTNAPFQMPLVR